ncbi:MAG: protein kinase [Leptolyngbya sp. SIO4C5]|uniref:serine/threonine-protein kinase n=1 Tax=Sphaerothrix gracilis TaxID=3151835 RepID=UPI0013C12770|nr:protein kinase [Leptolyngbya sp. SIO4C5]
MICCLNPNCAQPINPDAAIRCQSCNTLLVQSLRGRYRPIKLIGRGGFGRTYLAKDSDRLNSYCVLKQFAPQAQGPKSLDKAIQLFQQEAERLHELGEHPQIPTLMAYFEQERYLYLVQQMIEGKTLLQEMRKRGTLDEAEVRSLLEDLLPVLQFVHERNIIHRDITPSNLIRRRVDSKLVLIDFGVAKQFTETILHEPGTRIGTEGYAPIEQLRGGQAYPSSDLYSLGATCLHLLTGVKPERLYSPLEGRWLWREALQQNNLTVSPQLGNVLDRLVKDLISDRYKSAQEVLADLRGLPSLEGTVPGWVRQHPEGKISTSSPPSAPSAKAKTTQPPSRPPSQPPNRAATYSGGFPVSQPPSKRVSGPRGWRCIRTLTGHSSWVTTIAFNPKTPILASGSLDDSIRLWNLQTGALLQTLAGHARGVNEVAISPGGQVLASCGDDDTVKVWNLATGELLQTIKGHIRDVNSVAVGTSGWLLASGSDDRTVKLWKLDKGTLLKSLTGSAGMIKSVVITPDERYLISGGLDNKVRLWNLEQGNIIRVFSGHFNSVNQVTIAPNGKLIASASKDKTVRLWSLASGGLVQTLSDHTQDVNSVAIAPNSATIVSGSRDGTVKIWNGQTGTLQHTLTEHAGAINAVAIHRSGQYIASASADKTIKIWQNL